MQDAGSVAVRALGIVSAVVVLSLGAGAVYGELKDEGIQCDSGVRAFGVGEPDLTEIKATSPVEALEETIAEDGEEFVGLDGMGGTARELAAGFQPVPEGRDEASDGSEVFEFRGETGIVVARVTVEPTDDGRYFVSSVQSCREVG